MIKLIKKPIGVIEAEGVGPEIVGAAIECLHAIEDIKRIKFNFVKYQGKAPATKYSETAYRQLLNFYNKIKFQKGCIIRGGIYARTVYRLREDFNAVYKPIYFEPIPELFENSLLKKEVFEKINILLIRENSQGLLFSKEKIKKTKRGEQVLYGIFTYKEDKIKSLAELSFKQAQRRRKILNLFIKGDVWQGLLPLWLKVFEKVNKKYRTVKFDWDHADTGFADFLMHPTKYDVIVTLGIVGDTLTDPMAVLLYGTRAITPSANISPDGLMTFQTIHGASTAIGGQNKANPIAMIRAAAKMLDLFFEMPKEANLIEKAIRKVLTRGYRTIDIYHSDNSKHKLVGTKEITALIIQEIKNLANR